MTIYKWVINNIEYDDVAAENSYKPEYLSVERALKEKKTLCYGYTYLFNALAQYYGLKSQMSIGYLQTETVSGYHAWNTVYDDETRKLYLIDCTTKQYTYYAIDDGNDPKDIEFFNTHKIWSSKHGKYLPFYPNFKDEGMIAR